MFDYQIKSFDSAIKDVDVKKSISTGYLANFESLDSDGDIIEKGAFTKTLKENGVEGTGRIKHLLDHKKEQVIGKFLVLKEDNFGLYYESKIGTHDLGVDFLKMAESGLITEHSIGYRPIKEIQKNDANHLLELNLREGSSLKFWGANQNTPFIGLKSANDIEEELSYLTSVLNKYEKALKNGSFTDETFKEIIIPRIGTINDKLTSLLKSVEEKEPIVKITFDAYNPTKDEIKQIFLKTLNKN